jgi:two-component system, cell cycle response regulator DivK
MSTDEGRQKPLVLLVDDFSDTRSMYAEFLSFSGFDVAEAGDGQEAVDQTVALRPSLVVMDLSLPGLSGSEATRRIRNDPRTAAIPVLVVSGHTGSEIDEARSAGCTDVLVKPCAPDELVARIEATLRR